MEEMPNQSEDVNNYVVRDIPEGSTLKDLDIFDDVWEFRELGGIEPTLMLSVLQDIHNNEEDVDLSKSATAYIGIKEDEEELLYILEQNSKAYIIDIKKLIDNTDIDK